MESPSFQTFKKYPANIFLEKGDGCNARICQKTSSLIYYFRYSFFGNWRKVRMADINEKIVPRPAGDNPVCGRCRAVAWMIPYFTGGNVPEDEYPWVKGG
jgi:hypothetical protein